MYEDTSFIANLSYPVSLRHGQRASVIAIITEHGLRRPLLISLPRLAYFSETNRLWNFRGRTVSVESQPGWLTHLPVCLDLTASGWRITVALLTCSRERART